jgi:hypothetical protein
MYSASSSSGANSGRARRCIPAARTRAEHGLIGPLPGLGGLPPGVEEVAHAAGGGFKDDLGALGVGNGLEHPGGVLLGPGPEGDLRGVEELHRERAARARAPAVPTR